VKLKLDENLGNAARAVLETLTGALEREQLDGCLWIIEIGRLRIHQGDKSS
jgi:hypothetical protein